MPLETGGIGYPEAGDDCGELIVSVLGTEPGPPKEQQALLTAKLSPQAPPTLKSLLNSARLSPCVLV